jgi:glycosyltransferase involved in cell wall biosynthesis
MRALLLCSRFPWPPYTGDRLRAANWAAALAPSARVALVAPEGVLPREVPVEFFPASRTLARLPSRAWRVMREGLPFQSLLAAPYDFASAIAAAERAAGPFDVTVAVLARAHPWVREALPSGGLRILDAIDSLRQNAEERARVGKGAFWREEARRLGRAEREIGRDFDHVVVVNADEVDAFAPAAVAVPIGVELLPLDAAQPRRFDVGFWGRLGYFANADAVQWLLDEIWPAIRAAKPDATLAVAGADAPSALRRAVARAGATLLSPVADMPAFARSVKVALLPVRYGSGQLTKVLEAAEGGCAIVATPHALRGLGPLASHTRVAGDAGALAAAALALLDDETTRTQLAARARGVIESRYSRAASLRALAALAGVPPAANVAAQAVTA